jgi:hypothetical protein
VPLNGSKLDVGSDGVMSTIETALAGYEELAAVGLTTPQIKRLARKRELCLGHEKDASKAGMQRLASVRWCYRTGSPRS